MQKAMLVGVVFVATFLVGAGGGASAQEPLKIGVVAPLSGQNAQFGANIHNGIDLAARTINDRGGVASLGGASVEVVYADATSPSAAGAAVQRLQHLLVDHLRAIR